MTNSHSNAVNKSSVNARVVTMARAMDVLSVPSNVHLGPRKGFDGAFSIASHLIRAFSFTARYNAAKTGNGRR
jgi:hypothetical protein